MMLLVTTILGVNVLFRSTDIAWGNFQVMEGKVLSANVSSTAEVADNLECLYNCLGKNDCFSANLVRNDSSSPWTCQLLTTDPFRNVTRLGESSGSKLFYFKSDCSSLPCKNDGLCIPLYPSGSQECHCVPGFVGSKCERSCTEVPLGMKDGRIRNDQISISSCANSDCSTYPPYRGRLDISSWPYGAQTAGMGVDPNPWFQVKLIEITYVTEIALQGYGASNSMATTSSFQVSSSLDLLTWQLYKEEGSVKTFPGNTHPHVTVKNRLNKPLRLLAIRLLPKTCNGLCSLRVELYGCIA